MIQLIGLRCNKQRYEAHGLFDATQFATCGVPCGYRKNMFFTSPSPEGFANYPYNAHNFPSRSVSLRFKGSPPGVVTSSWLSNTTNGTRTP